MIIILCDKHGLLRNSWIQSRF